MTGDRDEALGRLTEELMAAVAAGDSIVLAVWAQRFAVDEADVVACLRALQALELGLGEEPAEGAPELPPPQLPDDYEVLGELGRGGMGVVYRARQRSLGREVAIKVLRPGELVFGEALRRFRTEAKSLARLRHRHIVSVHDLGEGKDGTLWFTMDLVEGGTLAAEIAGTGRLLPTRAVRIVRQVASAIAHAHSHGIVHRDLKPQNVLLDRAGDAYVADFGLARDAAAAGTRTLTGELLGTPAYMSPEQARGDAARIGEASDVWALGALLYEMLTGRGPFGGLPLHATITAILEQEPKPPRAIEPRVPRELAAICLQALQKRPEARYATALAFAEDVERFADGRPVLARSPGASVRLLRAAWRQRRALTLVALAVGATLLAVVAWLPSLRRAALLDEVQRLLEVGEPVAALATARGLLADVGGDERERDAVELAFARAANDCAAARLLAGDEDGARALADEAQARAVGKFVVNGFVPADEQDRQADWVWEHARSLALRADQRVQSVNLGVAGLQRLHTGLRDPRPESALPAALLATALQVPIEALDGEERVRVLDVMVRAAAMHARGGLQFSLSFPWNWREAEGDGWWSPAAEARLAELAVDERRSVLERVAAFRGLCHFAGLPGSDLVDIAPVTGGVRAVTPEAVARSATWVVPEWRRWQSLSHEDQLRARVDLLVDALDAPSTLAMDPSAVRSQIRMMLGQAPPRTGVRQWWQGLRQRPFAELLRQALGIAPDAVVSVAAALDAARSTSFSNVRSEQDQTLLWQQLAWLQVPAGATFLHASPRSGWRWRTSVLEAAGLEDPRHFVVRAAVLRFDDGAAEPTLVAQRALPARLGSPIRMVFEAEHGEAPWISSRRLWEDEQSRCATSLVPVQRGAPPIGLPSLGRLLVVVDAEFEWERGLGVGLDLRARLAPVLPDREWSEMHQGSRRTWCGQATAADGTTLVWDSGRRASTFLLLVQLAEGDEAAEQPLGAWRDAVLRRWRELVATREGYTQADLSFFVWSAADWLTPSWWPMPEALDAMRTVAAARSERAFRSPNEAMQQVAMQLAGAVVPPPPTVSPTRVRYVDATPLRIAVATPNPEVRAQALEALVRADAVLAVPAFAATLRDAAAQKGFALPAQLQQRVDAAPVPGGLWDTLWRGRTALVAGWFVLAALLVAWTRHPQRGREAWGCVALFVAASWSFVHVQIGGVVLNPTFVGLAVALVLTLVCRRPWTTFRALLVLAQLGFVVWGALAWFGRVWPPHGLEFWNGLAILLSGITIGTRPLPRTPPAVATTGPGLRV